MIQDELIIQNKLGIHARAASKMVSLASKYESETTLLVVSSGMEANCKSIMGLMILSVSYGEQVRLSASGADELEAIDNVRGLINNKFGEE
jgi:phosphocarrier protein HPr